MPLTKVTGAVSDIKVADVIYDDNTSPPTMLVDGLATDMVHKTGNETIAGEKTFSNAVKVSQSIVVDNASGVGIKTNLGSPDWAWQDLFGSVIKDDGGANAPAFDTYYSSGGILIKQYKFGSNDECYIEFHIPHDYAPGTDLYIHAHWSQIAAAGSPAGIVTWTFDAMYAKGHQQMAFTEQKCIVSVTQDASTTAFEHMIAETKLSQTASPNTLLDSSAIETDGVILVRLRLTGNTTGIDPFVHFVDIHYQSTGIGTKNKAPNFFA